MNASGIDGPLQVSAHRANQEPRIIDVEVHEVTTQGIHEIKRTSHDRIRRLSLVRPFHRHTDPILRVPIRVLDPTHKTARISLPLHHIKRFRYGWSRSASRMLNQ